MSKCESTPGPWRLSKNQGASSWEIYTNNHWIANVYPGYGQKIEAEFKECEANARLIAAAPALLAACRKAKEAVYETINGRKTNLSFVWNELEAAIALAEKRQ